MRLTPYVVLFAAVGVTPFLVNAQDTEENLQDLPRREILDGIRAVMADEQDRRQKAGGGEVADTPFTASESTDQKLALGPAEAGEPTPMPPVLGVQGGGPAPPLPRDLWVHVQGSYSWRADFAYQSKEYKVSAWVTQGRDGARVPVPKLEASFSGVCDSKSRSWTNSEANGFSYSQRHKGVFSPGSGMCMPSNVCFEGCATNTYGYRWCARTSACR